MMNDVDFFEIAALRAMQALIRPKLRQDAKAIAERAFQIADEMAALRRNRRELVYKKIEEEALALKDSK